MALGLAAAGLGALGSTYFNMQGARERQRAMEGVADQEQALANWYAGENARLMGENQAQYGNLSRQRAAALSGLISGYTAQPEASTAPVQIQGDPRFDMGGDFGGMPGAGRQWAAASRARIGRTQGLRQAVSDAQMREGADRLQRGQAMAGYQQTEGSLGRQARDYGDLAAIRQQVLENQMISRQGDLARARANASQAGSEKMLYAGLFGLGGQAGASFLPMGGGAGAAMPVGVGRAPVMDTTDPRFRWSMAQAYGG